jgi:translation elongation factor EF-Ts
MRHSKQLRSYYLAQAVEAGEPILIREVSEYRNGARYYSAAYMHPNGQITRKAGSWKTSQPGPNINYTLQMPAAAYTTSEEETNPLE